MSRGARSPRVACCGYARGVETSRFEIGSSASSYEILARLAKGGMAELFLARSTTTAGVTRFVVMKRVLRERASDFAFVQMFLDEARLAAQLQHPNIAQVFDVGMLGDSYFFTMEYVHGETVRAILRRTIELERPLPLACVLAIAIGAAAGLHHAHERIGVDGKPLGIVHRDVSPSNLMVGYEGHVKLVDFGVAKAASRESQTHSGTVKGKIAYLSPEQATGAAVDRRSDVFSLGIVLWEMAAGQRLYKRDSDFLAMRAIVEDAVAPPSSLRPDLPPAFDAVVLRCLAKDPGERFQTAHDVFQALEHVALGAGVTISSVVLSRLLHELFGPRPEPWSLLRRDITHSTVTVTVKPVPDELHVAPASPVDAQLAAIHELRSADTVDRRTAPYVLVDASGTVRPLAAPHRPRRGLWIAAAVGIAAIAAAVAIAFSTSVPVVSQPVVQAADADAAVVDGDPSARIAESVPPPDAPSDAMTAEPAESPEPSVPQPIERVRPASDRDVFAACSTRLTTPAECVLVACRLRRTERARTWFAQVPAAKRTRVSQRCRAAGVTLAPRATTPDCEADPSRCQF